MGKILNKYLLFFVFTLSLFSGVENKYPSMGLINSKIKIIDIRTEGEWYETGVLKNSYAITFFKNNGSYDISDFLSKLNRVIEKDEKFAIICRTGSRTKTVANFLGRNGYNVINLTGGIFHAVKKLGIRTVKYNSTKRLY